MILVADSGSTKTEWKVIKDGIPLESLFSAGINPYFLSGKEIFRLLKKEVRTLSGQSFSKVFFYGTGCNSTVKEAVVKEALDRFLPAGEINIGSDLLGAAHSLCMGTGSNSCYYDGEKIVSNVSPLGYILGDEGGGAFLGRKLVSAVLKKQVSKSTVDLFFGTYKITAAEILENVYMKPFPNRFLGQFAKFISANIENPELQEIVTTSFDDFIKRNILQYPQSAFLPVHFTGSIAFHFRPFLEDLLIRNNLKPGIITITPIDNLVRYHIINSR
jgi:glucosamine kinase